MITTVSSSASLATALKSASAGDTILLAAGSYNALSLSGLAFTSAVTIKSADIAHEAVINGLTLTNVTGLAFSGVAFATNGGTAVSLYGSKSIAFDAIQLYGVNNGNAMMIRDTSGVTVSNSDIGKFSTGINEINAQNITITGNTFHDIASGDIRGGGAINETISGNHFLDAKATVADHSDVIQLWQDNTANHVTISGNTFGGTAPVTPPVVTNPPPVTTPPVVITPPVVTSPPPVVTPPAGGSVTVSSSAALATALKSAHAGDTILLAAGTYSAVNLSGLNFSSAVTIQSADNSHEAVINGLTVSNSAGLAFNHVDVASNGATAVSVYGSHNITFDSINEHGSALGDGSGMMIRDSSNVSLTNSDIGKLGTGVNELNSTNLTLTGNNFHDIQSGAIRGAGDTNETISGNHFLDAKATVADHSDVIQLWQDNTANHVTITGNTFGTTPTTPPVVSSPPPPPVVSTPPPPVTSSTGGSSVAVTGHTTTVTTSDALWAALKSAHDGDTILLAPGTYAPISLWQFQIAGNVTVQSADNSNLATLTGLKILSSSGMTFQNLNMPVDNGATAVTVLDSTNVVLNDLKIHGTAATD
ncbi:MAG: right-handed parallel beta-helix repeat-containing protein, partial [Caulobacterales bacterium]